MDHKLVQIIIVKATYVTSMQLMSIYIKYKLYL